MTGVGVVEFLDVEIPEPEAGELLIRTEVTAVSPGTELRCLAGKQPDSVPFPFVSGYSLAGVVESAPEGSEIKVGTRVFCTGTNKVSIHRQWGAHVSHAIVNPGQVVPIPDHCSSKSAVFSKMVAIALRGSRVAQPRLCDSVAVIGLGPIGMLSTRVYKAAGANVLGLDLAPSRVEIARKAGVKAEMPINGIKQMVHDYFGHGADIIVDATGAPQVLPLSMSAAKEMPWGDSSATGSKLVIQGSYPDTFTLPYQEAFLKELHILLPRDHSPKDLVDACALIADGKVEVEDLISWFGQPCEASHAFGLLTSDPTKMTVAFDWSLT